MTVIGLSPTDLAEFETDLASGLAIDSFTQDLLFRQARTPRAFTETPVSDATIRAVYDLIKWGPTGRNGQPLRIVLVRSPEARGAADPAPEPGQPEQNHVRAADRPARR